MSDPVTNVQIEDVLSSIRRLVTADTPGDKDGAEQHNRVQPNERAGRYAKLNLRGLNSTDTAPIERKAPESKLVLTPSQRVDDAFLFGTDDDELPGANDDVAFAFNDFAEEDDLAEARQDVQDVLENELPDLSARAGADETSSEDSDDAVMDDSVEDVAVHDDIIEAVEQSDYPELLESAEHSDDGEATEETYTSDDASLSDDPGQEQHLSFLKKPDLSEDPDFAHEAATAEDEALQTEETEAEETGARPDVLELTENDLADNEPSALEPSEPEHDTDPAAAAQGSHVDEVLSETDAADDAEHALEDVNDLDVPEFLLRTGTETDTSNDIESDETPVRSFPSFAEVQALKQADAETQNDPVAFTAKLESLEAAVSEQAEDWEPDCGDQESLSATEVEPLPWQDIELETADMPDAEVEAGSAVDMAVDEAVEEAVVDVATAWAVEEAVEAADETEASLEMPLEHEDLMADLDASDTDANASDAGFASDAVIEEAALRDMIGEIVRQELQGALGERITRNVRKLVRREIHRALLSKGLE